VVYPTRTATTHRYALARNSKGAMPGGKPDHDHLQRSWPLDAIGCGAGDHLWLPTCAFRPSPAPPAEMKCLPVGAVAVIGIKPAVPLCPGVRRGRSSRVCRTASGGIALLASARGCTGWLRHRQGASAWSRPASARHLGRRPKAWTGVGQLAKPIAASALH
jgi:hypothetical protein